MIGGESNDKLYGDLAKFDGRASEPPYQTFDDQQKEVIREAIAMALEDAGKRFIGEIAYNFTAADGYANANDINSELFSMAEEYRRGVRNET